MHSGGLRHDWLHVREITTASMGTITRFKSNKNSIPVLRRIQWEYMPILRLSRAYCTLSFLPAHGKLVCNVFFALWIRRSSFFLKHIFHSMASHAAILRCIFSAFLWITPKPCAAEEQIFQGSFSETGSFGLLILFFHIPLPNYFYTGYLALSE